MPLSAGDKLGPYEILAPLGAGGMGEVWKARDTRLDRLVAIKQLKANHSRRFEQEARSIAALNHPHICQIYDIGPDYLVLEYVEGKPLKGPLPAEEALRLAIQMASALEEAHGHGILHRDLKPANILVTARGTAKLLDFGLAKLMTDSQAEVTETIEGTVAGTAAYMSPEQAQGKPLDERSDVFSFGAVLYEMASGARAFGSGSTVEVLSAILRDEPHPLRAAPGIARIVMRCLRKPPSERFQSMTEIRRELEAVAAKPAGQQPSIAVLPFANMSRDADDEYFSDGLAEEIINALAQIPGLKVTARTSAFAFRGKEQDIRKIAEALDVRTVLEGSVRRSGNRIRVTAQLINAADGYHLWSQRYDREMADIFEVQDEISAAIAAALQLKLAPKTALAARYKPKLPAYEAYLRARHYQLQLSPGSWEKAKEGYEEAIALDPHFAAAYAELAGLFTMAAALGMRPVQEIVPQVRAWARKALDLEPALPEAHGQLGVMALLFDNDRGEAQRRFALITERESLPPICRFLYTGFLLSQHRPLEAIEQMQRAVEEDPLFPLWRVNLALSLQAAGRSQEAVRELNHTLALDENFPLAYSGLAQHYASIGSFQKALPFAEKAYSLAPQVPVFAGILAGVLVRTGDGARANEILTRLGPATVYGVPRALAYFHQVAGDTERAANCWEQAFEQRDGGLAVASVTPLFKPLRESAHWPKLARMMNLPDT